MAEPAQQLARVFPLGDSKAAPLGGDARRQRVFELRPSEAWLPLPTMVGPSQPPSGWAPSATAYASPRLVCKPPIPPWRCFGVVGTPGDGAARRGLKRTGGDWRTCLFFGGGELFAAWHG